MCREIYLDAPSVGDLEKKYLNSAIEEGYVSTIGPYIAEFEKIFSAYLEVKRSISTQSGTAALHMALYELGIGAGDEVIVPALTFIATVNPVVYVGARPVFVDVDINTWDIDPREVKKAISKKTKAIIPVHLYGNPCNMDMILDIAKKHNLFIIEDATESLGAKYKDKYTGTFGDFGCFSFNGNKIITTGGGGMMVGNNEERLDHIKFLVNQARSSSGEYYYSEMGFNYRMTNIEAALGLAQIQRLNEFLLKKKTFNTIYRENLKDIKSIRFQNEYDQAKSCWWLSCILFEEDVDVTGLQKELKNRGVPTRRIFTPVIEFPPYKKNRQGNYKNSYYIYKRGLCLPSSTLNSQEQIYYISQSIRDLLKVGRKARL